MLDAPTDSSGRRFGRSFQRLATYGVGVDAPATVARFEQPCDLPHLPFDRVRITMNAKDTKPTNVFVIFVFFNFVKKGVAK